MEASRSHKHERGRALVLLLGLLLVLVVGRCGGQLQPCPEGRLFISSLSLTTLSSSVELECEVPNSLVLDAPSFSWTWIRLASGTTTEEELALDGPQAVLTANFSAYDLPLSCGTSKLYEALYHNDTSPSESVCIHNCLFSITLHEVRSTELLQMFSRFPSQTGVSNLSLPSNRTSALAMPEDSFVTVGSCISEFKLDSGCVATVRAEWFIDGVRLNPQAFPDRYMVTSQGELNIRSLSAGDAGYYACLTTLQDGLGGYLTVDVTVTLQQPEPTEPTSESTTRPTMASTEGGSLLEPWEVGLIVANAAVVALFVMAVALVCVWRVRRRRRRSRRSGKRGQGGEGGTKGIELSTLEETDGHATDFTGPTEIPFSSILFEELLHKGTFKVVHHATVTDPALGMMTVPVAVKRLRDVKSELGREELMAEAYVLRAIHDKAGPHPNIVSLLGVTTPQGGPTCLLLEFVPHGSLESFLLALRDGPVPEWYIQFVRETQRDSYHKHISGDLMSVLVQVAEGMKFLTDRNFIHRDLSTRNILIGDRLNIKIANPGMHHEGYYYVVTERQYTLQDMAPECLWEKRHSVWSDIWSFGILTYKVASLGSTPFPGVQVNDLYNKMVAGARPQQLASFSNELYFLVHKCWQFISVQRPTFTSILSDLQDMAEKPSKHIILKVSKADDARGYVSETGQVFLHNVTSFSKQQQGKYHRRQSGNQASIYSSMDDTTFTRETDVTTVFTPSEADAYDSYEDYLKGEFEATRDWVDNEGGGGGGGNSVPSKIAYFSGEGALPNGVRLKEMEDLDSKEAGSVVAKQPEEEGKEGSEEPLIRDDDTSDQSESPKQSHDSSSSHLVLL